MQLIPIINQLFELSQKLQAKAETIADRNIARIFHELDSMGYYIMDPINRKYQETDTDLEANLSGPLQGELRVTRVLKPVIYQKNAAGEMILLQKGIVIVEGK